MSAVLNRGKLLTNVHQVVEHNFVAASFTRTLLTRL